MGNGKKFNSDINYDSYNNNYNRNNDINSNILNYDKINNYDISIYGNKNKHIVYLKDVYNKGLLKSEYVHPNDIIFPYVFILYMFF